MGPAVKVAVVTARQARGLDEDEPLLLDALARAGAEPEVCVWDDVHVPWESYDGAIVRSTWDYALRHREFLAWADRVGEATCLINPEPVLAWNTDKTYLRDLAGAGVPIVPTTWVAPGADQTQEALADLPHGEIVVKPTVSAGSRDTARYPGEDRDAALAHVRALTAAGRTAMVQPYVSAVDREGECALLYIDGAFSHAVTKAALLRAGAAPTQDLFAAEDIRPASAGARRREVADAVLRAVPFPIEAMTYARVDLVSAADGQPLLLELELTEPSLFLTHHPPAADALARSVVAEVREQLQLADDARPRRRRRR